MIAGSSRESLSSILTIIYKFIFPTIWLGGFGLGTIAMVLSEPPDWAFVIPLLIGFLLFYFFCFPLKSVEIDESYLYVSNYIKTIRVPFSQIVEVTESRLVNIHPIWIRFNTPTEFGSMIIFMPYFEFGTLFMMSHPVVTKLRELARLTN
jgi:hypothetical protein